MGVMLYRNAREIEFGEKIPRKIDSLKKRARAETYSFSNKNHRNRRKTI